MKKNLIFILLFLGISLLGHSFSWPSNSVRVIHFDTLGLEILHYHHISDIYRYQKAKGLEQGSNFYFNDSLNTESWICVKNKDSGHVLFRTACSTFTHIIVLENGKYIVGLSNLKESRFNSVVFNAKGEVLFKKKVTSFEYVMSDEGLKALAETYPCEFLKLIEFNDLSRQDSVWCAAPSLFSWDYEDFSSFMDSLGLSNHFMLSGTLTTGGYNRWFNEENIQIKVKENGTELTEFSILNKENNFRKFNFSDSQFSPFYFINRGFLELTFPEEDCPADSVSEFLVKRYEDYYQIQIGAISDRLASKSQVLAESHVLIDSKNKAHGLELASCELILVYEEDGESKFQEYYIDDSGLIPNRFHQDLRNFSDVKFIGVENIQIAAKDGVRRLSSFRYHILA